MRLDAHVDQSDDESDDESDDKKEDAKAKVGAPTITPLALILQQPEKKSKPIDSRKLQRVAAARSIAQSLAISAFSQSGPLLFLTTLFRLPSSVCPSLSRLGSLSADFLRPVNTRVPSRCRLAPLQVTTSPNSS